MAAIRNEEAREVLLPADLWVTHYQVSRSGRSMNSYYGNVRTRQKFYSKATFYKHYLIMAARSEAWLNRETAEEERFQICSRCREFGHNCITCPFLIVNKIFTGTRIYRCSRCHCLGHNVRTCRRRQAIQN